jgi:hypothetical protein
MGASLTDYNGPTIAIEAAHVPWHFLLSSRATVFVAGAKQNAIEHEFERALECETALAMNRLCTRQKNQYNVSQVIRSIRLVGICEFSPLQPPFLSWSPMRLERSAGA